MGTQHPRTCHLCEAMCGLLVTVDGGRVTDIRPDVDDPFSRGHMCPKGYALKELHEDPDRLRAPMRRTAAGWREVSWDEALHEAAEGLQAVQRAHGRNAVGVYVGNPAIHNHGTTLAMSGFVGALRTATADANSQGRLRSSRAC
ncbi:MAG: molybdopterin-dependent oxidoreductase [Polyangiales bacterium]